MSASSLAAAKQPFWFLALFGLAAGGGAIAYVPLLTVILPLKITALMGSEDVGALAQVTFYGAVIASLANIAFGMLSDRSGNRIFWIVVGLITSSLLLVAIDYTRNVSELIIVVMAWQVGLNMVLGPLVAWAGDLFPDSQKGVLGGALSLAPALGAVAGSLVTFEAFVSTSWRLPVVAGLVVAFILPVIFASKGRSRPELMHIAVDVENTSEGHSHTRSVVVRMWSARFLVQIAEAGLFAFLLFWLRSLSPGVHENYAANIFSIVLIISVPVALVMGRWSDKSARPIAPLALCALLTSGGLIGMALADELNTAIYGYVIFSIAASVFLSLHTSQTLRVLPNPRHRGRDMGIFNLTNTMPSLVMPWLTLSLVPGFGFSALFVLFAALAACAGLLLATLPVRG